MSKNIKRFICMVFIFMVWSTTTACGNDQDSKNPDRQMENETTLQEQADGESERLESEEESNVEGQTEIQTTEAVPENTEQETEKAAARFQQNDNEINEEENEEMRMKVQVEDSIFTADLENNAAVHALVEMMEKEPVVIRMSDYSGFEKVGSLGKSLPTDNSQTTTEAGDIVLYQGNQIVMFYGSNSWSYTRLGRIDDLTGWEEALGSGDVTVTFFMED